MSFVNWYKLAANEVAATHSMLLCYICILQGHDICHIKESLVYTDCAFQAKETYCSLLHSNSDGASQTVQQPFQ